ncbi:MAG: lysozyme inhibitor LprI family protein [Syntrophales bacterium]
MKKVTLLFVLLSLILTVSAGAQEGKKEHPIDQWLGKCILQDESTAGMRNCMAQAYDMWDKELNKAYKSLMNKLSLDGKKALKTSHLAWIKYRDAESIFNDEITALKGGTLYLLMGDSSRMEMVKERTLELKSYIGTLDE